MAIVSSIPSAVCSRPSTSSCQRRSISPVLRRRLDAGVLEVVLLQIDERRPPMPRLGQQIEAVELAFVEEHLARLPGYALVDQRLAQPVPQPIPNAIHDLERALGPADRAGPVRQARLPVDDDAAVPLAGEVQRRHQPHRPRPDDDDRMMRRLRPTLIGRPLKRKHDLPDVRHGCCAIRLVRRENSSHRAKAPTPRPPRCSYVRSQSPTAARARSPVRFEPMRTLGRGATELLSRGHVVSRVTSGK